LAEINSASDTSDDDFPPRQHTCTAVSLAPRQHALSGKRKKKNHEQTRWTTAYVETPRLFTVLMEVHGKETPSTLDSACTVCLPPEDLVVQSMIVPISQKVVAAKGNEYFSRVC